MGGTRTWWAAAVAAVVWCGCGDEAASTWRPPARTPVPDAAVPQLPVRLLPPQALGPEACTRVAYDATGFAAETEVFDARGHSLDLRGHDGGRTLQRFEGDLRVLREWYDRDEQLLERTRWTYDASGRPTRTEAWTLRPTGHQQSQTVVTTYAYGADGRLERERVEEVGAAVYRRDYTYGPFGLEHVALTVEEGWAVPEELRLTYDATGALREREYSRAEGRYDERDTYEAGRLVRSAVVQSGSSAYTSFAYDEAGRLVTRRMHQVATGDVDREETFAYAGAALAEQRVRTEHRWDTTVDVRENFVRRLAYDGKGRLVEERAEGTLGHATYPRVVWTYGCQQD